MRRYIGRVVSTEFRVSNMLLSVVLVVLALVHSSRLGMYEVNCHIDTRSVANF